ncbi:MAG: MBOAT family protein, partial [Pseudobutyrivibrio sp.]|nr:MBOAT family protein [Pseudobutyrivibrio sp.]
MQYAFFFIIVCAVYYIIPKKSSYIWLLAASYFFYMQWNAVYAVLILGVTAITYAAGFAIDKWRDKGKLILALTVMANLFLMGYFKYTNFILETVSNISGGDFEALDIILPVGISFYILQALGYVIDVYRGTVEAEHNPLRYALFVSFFPQLVAGPIERSGNLMHQLKEPKPLTSQALLQGIIMIFYGLWTKVLIADGVAIIVNEIFNKYEEYYGLEIIFATVLFAIQIYCDFYGYTIIAIGSAKILGVDLMQNFQSPYMAKNVTDFWKRWHISLTSWFRDYL